MKKMKIKYRDYKVTFDNTTGDLLLYKDENNKISSVVSVKIKDEEELRDLVRMVLETLEKADMEHLNTAFEKYAAIEQIDDMFNPKYYN